MSARDWRTTAWCWGMLAILGIAVIYTLERGSKHHEDHPIILNEQRLLDAAKESGADKNAQTTKAFPTLRLEMPTYVLGENIRFWSGVKSPNGEIIPRKFQDAAISALPGQMSKTAAVRMQARMLKKFKYDWNIQLNP